MIEKQKNKVKSSSSKGKSKELQCYNCQGFGHMATECPSKVKSKRKGLVATWDDSSEPKSDREIFVLMVITSTSLPEHEISKVKSNNDTSGGESDHEKSKEDDAYEALYQEGCKLINTITRQEL